jgi:hypothetical protein
MEALIKSCAIEMTCACFKSREEKKKLDKVYLFKNTDHHRRRDDSSDVLQKIVTPLILRNSKFLQTNRRIRCGIISCVCHCSYRTKTV